MKAPAFNSGSILTSLILLLLFCLQGCSSCPMEETNWNSQIGKCSFDDMVGDYGQPWRDQIQPDGSRIAVWPAVREQKWEWRAHTHHKELEIEPVHLDKPKVNYDAYYHLTFDSHGLLKRWEKHYSYP